MGFDDRWEEVESWGFPLVQNRAELKWLYDRMEGANSYLEIGTSFGGSLFILADALAPNATIVSVDLPKVWTHPHKWERDRANFDKVNEIAGRLRSEGKQVVFFRSDSHAMNTARRIAWAGPYDVLFVDGDHSYAGARKDVLMYGPMSEHCYMHDVAVPEVRRAAEEFGILVEFTKQYGMGQLW